MNTCKNCKWWREHYNSTVQNKVIVQFKTCVNEHFIYGNEPASRGKPLTIDALLYSETLDDYNDTAWAGEVITGSDFGCIHWEKKE